MRIRNWLSTFHDGDGSRPETEEKHLLFSFAIYRKCWAFFFFLLFVFFFSLNESLHSNIVLLHQI